MKDQEQPNVARDLLRIHAVITRALEVAGRNCHDILSNNQKAPDGLLDYIQTCATVLKAHHELEDELAFPYFRDLLKEMPFEKLQADHKQIHEQVEKIMGWIGEQRTNRSDRGSLESITGALDKIAGIWSPHIRIEETHASVERLGQLIPVEEHKKITVQYSQHGMKHAQPGYLVVPFLLYNLDPESRKKMAKPMPGILTGFIMPVLWKRKWAPMKPYFLP